MLSKINGAQDRTRTDTDQPMVFETIVSTIPPLGPYFFNYIVVLLKNQYFPQENRLLLNNNRQPINYSQFSVLLFVNTSISNEA